MTKLKIAFTLAVTLAASSLAGYAQTKSVRTGVTTVNISPAFVAALGKLKVTPSPIGNSQSSGYVIDFPIVGGAFDTSEGTTEILHSGGLRLTAGSTVVDLRDFDIEATSKTPTITGLVLVDGKIVGRVALFNLSINPSDVQTSGGFLVVIDNVGVTLTAGAASTLDSVFKTSALTGGTNIGTATVVGILGSL